MINIGWSFEFGHISCPKEKAHLSLDGGWAACVVVELCHDGVARAPDRLGAALEELHSLRLSLSREAFLP